MIISLAQEKIRDAAKAAAREQAWTDGRGVRGVPVRREGEQPTGANWDLTAVLEAIDRADVLEWRGSDLTIRVRGDWPRVFTLSRGDDREGLADVVGSRDLDCFLELAGQVEAGHPEISTSGWAVTCPPPACGLTGAPHPSRPEAQHLAGVHDGLHHGGSPTATTAPAATLASAPASVPVRRVAGLVWEVDDPDGTPVYRGLDLELAEEIYHSSPPGSHLLPVAAAPNPVTCPVPRPAGFLADAGRASTGLLTVVPCVLALVLLGLAAITAAVLLVLAPQDPAARTERVCYPSGWAADVTTSPDGSLTATGEYRCHVTRFTGRAS